MIPQQVQDRAADVTAAGSAIGWLVSITAQTLPIVQWLAGVAAIVAAVAAAYYHVTRARK